MNLKILPTANLLKQCAQQIDPDGHKKHVCIIFSTWAPEALAPLKRRFNEHIMQYVDECIFSFDGHGAKPERSIMEFTQKYINTKYPEQRDKPWIFIDDQETNLNTAQQYFSQPIYCTKPIDAEHVLQHIGTIPTTLWGAIRCIHCEFKALMLSFYDDE